MDLTTNDFLMNISDEKFMFGEVYKIKPTCLVGWKFINNLDIYKIIKDKTPYEVNKNNFLNFCVYGNEEKINLYNIYKSYILPIELKLEKDLGEFTKEELNICDIHISEFYLNFIDIYKHWYEGEFNI